MTLLTGVTMIYLDIMVEPSLFFQDLWQQIHCWLPKKIQEFESLLEVQIHFCIFLSLLSKIGQSPPQLQYRHSKSSRHNSRFFKLFAPSLLENPMKPLLQVDLTTNVPSSSRASQISNRSSSPPASKAPLLKNFYSAKNHTPLLLSQLDSNKSPQTSHNFSRRRKPSSETLWVWHWRGQLLSCSPKTAPRSM